MKSRLILLLLAAHAGTALAQYKCTAANGSITFQQTPCFGAKSEEKLVVVPNGHPPAASGVAAPPVSVQPASGAASKVETNIDKRMLANYERQHQREALVQKLKEAQDDKEHRLATRAEATAAARRQFGDDPANAKALKDAIASIDSRYGALADLDETRIKSAQAALDNWDKAQLAAARAVANPASR